MLYAQERKFSWHNSLTCPECAQIGLVWILIHETCANRFILQCTLTFCSKHLLAERMYEKPSTWHFQCSFRTCVHNSSNQESYLRKPIVAKVTYYAHERTFPWLTSATRLVHYRPRHATLLGPYNRKSKNMVKTWFRCVLPISGQIAKRCCSLIQLWGR